MHFLGKIFALFVCCITLREGDKKMVLFCSHLLRKGGGGGPDIFVVTDYEKGPFFVPYPKLLQSFCQKSKFKISGILRVVKFWLKLSKEERRGEGKEY